MGTTFLENVNDFFVDTIKKRDELIRTLFKNCKKKLTNEEKKTLTDAKKIVDSAQYANIILSRGTGRMANADSELLTRLQINSYVAGLENMILDMVNKKWTPIQSVKKYDRRKMKPLIREYIKHNNPALDVGTKFKSEIDELLKIELKKLSETHQGKKYTASKSKIINKIATR
jgi:hypothetical protein